MRIRDGFSLPANSGFIVWQILWILLYCNMESKKTYHILPRRDGWILKDSYADEEERRFSTQKEAIDNGKAKAKKNRTILYIHGEDGFIKDDISYDPDISQPRGRGVLGEAKGKIKIAPDFDEEYVPSS
jgi:hypothetical protein